MTRLTPNSPAAAQSTLPTPVRMSPRAIAIAECVRQLGSRPAPPSAQPPSTADADSLPRTYSQMLVNAERNARTTSVQRDRTFNDYQLYHVGPGANLSASAPMRFSSGAGTGGFFFIPAFPPPR